MRRKNNLVGSMKDGNSGPDPLSVLPTGSFIKWEKGIEGNVLELSVGFLSQIPKLSRL